MSRNKSIFVTLIIAAMLAVILIGAHRLDERIFGALVALLACYGYVRGAGDVCRWMQAERQPVPVIEAEAVDDADPFAHDDEYGDGKASAFGGIRFKDGVYRESI